MNNEKNNIEIPLGLGMSLAHNAKAFQFFSSLNDHERQVVIDKARSIKSKSEMQKYVNSLT